MFPFFGLFLMGMSSSDEVRRLFLVLGEPVGFEFFLGRPLRVFILSEFEVIRLFMEASVQFNIAFSLLITVL